MSFAGRCPALAILLILAVPTEAAEPGSGNPIVFADLYGAYERDKPWPGYQWGTNEPALLQRRLALFKDIARWSRVNEGSTEQDAALWFLQAKPEV